MKALDISSDDRILIVAPHPDDECIGPGGVLLTHPDKCDVIVLTDGRQGQGDVLPEEEKIIRRHEFIDEMNSLGVNNYKLLDIEDGTLLLHQDCLSDIDIQNYSIVFVTGIDDSHPDHKAAFMCVRKAVEKIPYDRIPKCFIYEVHTPLQQPTHFYDISDMIEQKAKLVRFHKSQLKELPYDNLVKQCAEYRASLFRMAGKKIEVYEQVELGNSGSTLVSENDVLLQKERLIGWVLKRWVIKLLSSDSVSMSLRRRGINELYVYGYGDLGKLLVKELSDNNMIVRAVIDRRAELFTNESVDVIYLKETTEKLPVVVTAVFEYGKIKEILEQEGFDHIISLRELVESTK